MDNRLDFRFSGWFLVLLSLVAAGLSFEAAAPFTVLLLPLFAFEAMLRKGVKASVLLFVMVYGLVCFRYRYSNFAFGGLVCYALCETIVMKLDLEKRRPFKQRLFMHFTAPLLGLAGFIPWLDAYAGQNVAQGLAGLIREAVETSPRCDELLLELMVSGLARMHSSLLALQQAATVAEFAFLPQVRTELLNSFQTSMTLLFQQTLPILFTVALSLFALSMAMTPVNAGRRSGLSIQDPPPFEKWTLDWGMARFAGVFMTGAVFHWFTSNPVALAMGAMMGTLAQVLFAAQGLCVLAHWHKKRGVARFGRRVYTVLAAAFIYQLPLIIGILDVFMDFRGLCPKKEEDVL